MPSIRDRLNVAGIAMPVGMAMLVARRLALICQHWNALGPVSPGNGRAMDPRRHDPLASNGPLSNPTPVFPATTTPSNRGNSRNDTGFPVVEAGLCLLALEIAGACWVATGFSALVAIRFRYSAS